jgi:hypothetical protein
MKVRWRCGSRSAYRHSRFFRCSSVERWLPFQRKVIRFLGKLTLAVLFGCELTLGAQTPITQMYHKSWTARDGVPNNINSIIQGSDGMLWLATDAGLYRFDGVSFERYAPPRGQKLPSDQYNALITTRDGSLWISYLNGGLSRDQRRPDYQLYPRARTARRSCRRRCGGCGRSFLDRRHGRAPNPARLTNHYGRSGERLTFRCRWSNSGRQRRKSLGSSATLGGCPAERSGQMAERRRARGRNNWPVQRSE